MRVLVTNYHTRPVGGVETYLRSILHPLAERVGTLAVLTREGSSPGPGGVPVVGVPWLDASGLSPTAVAEAAIGWNPDVVYTHGLGPPEFDAALVARFPTVYFMHNYGGLCASGSRCHSFPDTRPCNRSLGLGCLALWYPRRCGGLNPIVAVRQFRSERERLGVLKACRAVVVASRHMATEMVRNGVPAERVHHLPLFPTDTASNAGTPPPQPPTGRILFVGRITPLKGWSHLLHALPLASKRLGRSLKLVVAGDGPDREKFEATARRDGVNAEFLGWVGPQQREHEMRMADLLVVPSVWPEPFGLAGIEAGSVGTPAVAYEIGGITDWLEPGISGESAPGDRPDPNQFARAIVRALQDQAHWQRLRVGAWEKSKQFRMESHLDILLPILRAAVD